MHTATSPSPRRCATRATDEETASRQRRNALKSRPSTNATSSAKADHEAVDFGDLIMRPTLLLESNKALQAAVQLRHRHVLVDEYQDVNRASVRLVKAIAGDGKRLWVVGDARQSIYRFRGASSVNMAGFKTEFPTADVDQLGISYRSTQQIIDAFIAFAQDMGASKGMLPLKLDRRPRRHGPERPELRALRSR